MATHMGHNNWLYNQLFVMLYQDVYHLYTIVECNVYFLSKICQNLWHKCAYWIQVKNNNTFHLFQWLSIFLICWIVNHHHQRKCNIKTQIEMLKILKQLWRNINTFNFFIDFSTKFFCTLFQAFAIWKIINRHN